MDIELVPIGSINQDPANLRQHSARNIATIKGSLKRFGQQKPLVVDRKGVVVTGNGTLLAAKELGWADIQIVRTGLAGIELVAFGIADNRSSDSEVGSTWDTASLIKTLAALNSEDAGLGEVTGFTADELAKLVSENSGDGVPNDPDNQWTGMPECDSEDQTAFSTLKLNFASAADRDAFAKLVNQPVTENTRSIWYPPAAIGHAADKRYQ